MPQVVKSQPFLTQSSIKSSNHKQDLSDECDTPKANTSKPKLLLSASSLVIRPTAPTADQSVSKSKPNAFFQSPSEIEQKLKLISESPEPLSAEKTEMKFKTPFATGAQQVLSTKVGLKQTFEEDEVAFQEFLNESSSFIEGAKDDCQEVKFPYTSDFSDDQLEDKEVKDIRREKKNEVLNKFDSYQTFK